MDQLFSVQVQPHASQDTYAVFTRVLDWAIRIGSWYAFKWDVVLESAMPCMIGLIIPRRGSRPSTLMSGLPGFASVTVRTVRHEREALSKFNSTALMGPWMSHRPDEYAAPTLSTMPCIPAIDIEQYARGDQMSILHLRPECHGDVLLDLIMEMRDDPEGHGFFTSADIQRVFAAFTELRVYALQYGSHLTFDRCSFLGQQLRLMFVTSSTHKGEPRSRRPWVVPALCVVSRNPRHAELLWVAQRARRRGYATHMVRWLNLVKDPTTGYVTPSAAAFWAAI